MRSAALRVGLRRASTWPLRTMSPFLTSMLSTMVSSKGCMTILGAPATSLPLAETILSMRMSPLATSTETTSRKTRRLVARDRAGMGVAMIAAEGLSNSRTTSGKSPSSAGSPSVTLGKRRGGCGMDFSLRIDVPVLLKPKMAVDGAALDEVAMCSKIEDLAAVEYEDLVAIDQRGEAVRDDHHRAPARHAPEVGVDQRLALRIERRGRFVEDHQLGIDDEGAGDGEALTLAAGEVGRAFLDPGLVTLRQALDELLGPGKPGRAHRVLEAEAGASGEDVVLHRAVEQEVLLQHDAEALAQMAQIDLAQLRPVDLHRAGIISVDSHQQARDRRLARTRTADQPEHGAGRDGEADLLERRSLGAFVFEGYLLEAHRPL